MEYISPTTYEVLRTNSPDFVSYLSDISGIDPLYADNGLNGGGWHMLNNGGKLNPTLTILCTLNFLSKEN